ncbi:MULTISPECIES: hypothetical protein [Curtobacterium]|uniref:Uncharacterized protein n=1 Tax=Curtobacterium citri TaxID=3055139 RepID=A0ABT7TAU2_9MICO|nr:MULTISPECIES: hypothetical protein [Curtobacterium]MDM7886681.1 hypothetical protein [Curtobacterium citri]
MSGAATDLSARLWDERDVLGRLVLAVDDAARADPLLDRLQTLRLEQDVLVHALAEQWGAAPDTATLRTLERVAPPPWDLLLPDHLAALTTLTAELDGIVPVGPVGDRWDRLRSAPR